MIEHRAQDLDELTVPVSVALKLGADLGQRGRQSPVFERRTIAQGAGLLHQNRQIMPGIVDNLVAPEVAWVDAALVFVLGLMATNDLANRRPRHRQRANDLLDRAVLLKIGAPYIADFVHANHHRQPFQADQGQKEERWHNSSKGVGIGRDTPPLGGHYCKRFYTYGA